MPSDVCVRCLTLDRLLNVRWDKTNPVDQLLRSRFAHSSRATKLPEASATAPAVGSLQMRRGLLASSAAIRRKQARLQAPSQISCSLATVIFVLLDLGAGHESPRAQRRRQRQRITPISWGRTARNLTNQPVPRRWTPANKRPSRQG